MEERGHFIEWIGELSEQWQRILKPNGSLYCFASPQLRARVEVKIAESVSSAFPSITWVKNDGNVENSGGKWRQAEKEAMRSYFPRTEAIIFAEQFAANEAMTFADYELNGQVFESLKNWFRSRARLAGIDNGTFNRSLGFASNGGGVASGVIGDKVQFAMPTAEVYAKMQAAYPVFDREYEDLRRIRRPARSTKTCAASTKTCAAPSTSPPTSLTRTCGPSKPSKHTKASTSAKSRWRSWSTSS
jgi:adenine-specific DNA-methyltransferase